MTSVLDDERQERGIHPNGHCLFIGQYSLHKQTPIPRHRSEGRHLALWVCLQLFLWRHPGQLRTTADGVLVTTLQFDQFLNAFPADASYSPRGIYIYIYSHARYASRIRLSRLEGGPESDPTSARSKPLGECPATPSISIIVAM